jgi:hypothetical protein
VSPKYKNSIKRNGNMQSSVIEMDCASGVVDAMRANTYCAFIGSTKRTVRQLPILEAGRWTDTRDGESQKPENAISNIVMQTCGVSRCEW